MEMPIEVSVVKIEEHGDEIEMEKRKYGIDDLFESLEMKEFDTVVFASREDETIVNGKTQKVTVGKNLKEKVRQALPSTKPAFVKGLLEEASTKYQDLGWEEKVVVGYLTSIGAEELSKLSQTEYFEVPSGLDFVGIAAEGMLDEKATLAARERLAALDTKNDKFVVYRDVRIESEKFGTLCGSHSSHLVLEGKEAGYGVFENAVEGSGYFGTVGECAGKGSQKTRINVLGDAGSGFMADSKEGHGSVDGSIKGSSAGAGSEHLMLCVEGNGGELLLAESKRALAQVGGAESYACYKAQEPVLVMDGKPGKLVGEGMTDGRIWVKELDTYAEPGKLLGYSGTGTITVSDRKYADILLKENKPGYTIKVIETFFSDNESGCKSCSCGTGACAKG